MILKAINYYLDYGDIRIRLNFTAVSSKVQTEIRSNYCFINETQFYKVKRSVEAAWCRPIVLQ